MKPRASRSRFLGRTFSSVVLVFCMALVAFGELFVTLHTAAATGQKAGRIPNDQLDSLVAPIALYPDPLLAQVLAASTYPLEIVQLQQWLARNKDLKGEALTKAVKKQDWDPSVQAMASFPDVVKQLAENIEWTSELGNAFLAQHQDVMKAVQRMRVKAQSTGNLKSTEQQKVEAREVEGKTVVVIEPASPQVVYVPSYDPVVVYGAPVYPYPPIYYPAAGYYAAGMALSFGIGVAMGAAWGGDWAWGWGWGCGWGYNNIYINNCVSHCNTHWQHNPHHRGGVPYPNRNIAARYGGTARGDSMATRQANARQSQLAGRQQFGARPSQKVGSGNRNWQHNPQHRASAAYPNRNIATRYGGTARGDSMAMRQANARQSQLAGRQQFGARPIQGQLDGGQQPGVVNRGGFGYAPNRGANWGGGGANRIGNHQVYNAPSGRTASSFGRAFSGMSGRQAWAGGQRGASSMQAFGGGGFGARGGGRARR